MTTPHSLHHSLFRPVVLHILRAAGYHSTRPSVLDSLTDLAARYMLVLAETTATHAAINHTELDITIEDVRLALQDCGALSPEKVLEAEELDGEEDMRGVENFMAWTFGKVNREIRRVGLEGADGTAEDYLTVLKKKHSTTDEDSRYTGTILGKPSEPRAIKIEGGDIASMDEWAERLRTSGASKSTSVISSRRQSSALSSLEDMEDMEF